MPYQIGKLSLSAEQLRPIVLRALPQSRSVHDVFQKVADEAIRTGRVQNPTGLQQSFGSYVPDHRDQMLVQDVLWAFIIEGIVYPGMDTSNPNLPWIHLSDYGKQVVASGFATPHDPDGYLTRLRSEVPTINETVVTYIGESLQTFRINCLLSSTITLGCASEEAVLLLVDATAASMPEQSRRDEFIRKTSGKFIRTQFEQLMKVLEPLKSAMPKDLGEDIDTWLPGVFNFIRNQRNDAGHPTGASFTREQAYANLQLFVPYCKRIFALIEHLKSHPIS